MRGTGLLKVYKHGLAFLMGVVVTITSITGCGIETNSKKADQDYIERQGFALNTSISVRIYGSQDEDILTQCMILCDDYDDLLSRTKEGSEIYELNENGEADVSRETLELIKEGLYYSELSKGAFDITIEPVSSLWDFTSGTGTLPDPEIIEEKLDYINYKEVEIEGNHVSLKEGMGLDLGAIAKGYIADRIKDYLLEQGIESAIINLGGNVLCVGNKPSGACFKVGIRNPRKEGTTIAELESSNQSVVTSGDYERYIMVDGERYCHILNPKTGYSYQNDLASVTILSDTSVQGDGLSTTCFALGLEEGLKLINSMDHVWAVFVDQDGNISYSDGLE